MSLYTQIVTLTMSQNLPLCLEGQNRYQSMPRLLHEENIVKVAVGCHCFLPVLSAPGGGLQRSNAEVLPRFCLHKNPFLGPEVPNHKSVQAQTIMLKHEDPIINAANFRSISSRGGMGFDFEAKLISNNACPLQTIAHTDKKCPQ